MCKCDLVAGFSLGRTCEGVTTGTVAEVENSDERMDKRIFFDS